VLTNFGIGPLACDGEASSVSAIGLPLW